MRHIIHTCLIGLRLLTAASAPSHDTAALDVFSNALMNRVCNIVFFDPGIGARKYTACRYA